MHRFLTASLLALAFTLPAAASAKTAEPKPARLADLVRQVNIPYERFTLSNGLKVLVHTDRKAPVVAVSVWYGVGSKHEPRGKTGFAHLFEHLMFNGTENVPGDFFAPLQRVGATDLNGTTWFDRTNYYQTVPTGALNLALMLESDRMGHLLGAVTQEVLDNQRSVVQNEKRQGDNNPFGLTEYEQLENLYPSGHPYHHSTIGSMADLDSATLDDVKRWFKDHYGPNNAILVLAGDIDLPTARAKVATWFGHIPAGPAIQPVAAPVPTLDKPLAKTIKDQVATTRITRTWAIPGLDNPDYLPLAMAARVLGGLASSRLDDALVRGNRLAVGVTASAQIFAQAGLFNVSADVTPGQDTASVGAALDAEVAKFLAEGPSADELLRAATEEVASEIRGLESVGGSDGKAPTLAEGLLYNGDPEHYRTELQRLAALTPNDVAVVTRKWLSRPAFSLTIEPGERTEGGEARGGFVRSGGTSRPAFFRDPLLDVDAQVPPAPDRSKLPEVGQVAALDFPAIERATLKNGIPVYFARRSAIPAVSVRISFNAGYAADPKAALGTESLLLNLMDEGTQTLDSSGLARARERLGATISLSATSDLTSFQLNALAPNLAPSLGLLSDMVRRPALSPTELERVRAQQLAGIAAEMKDPQAVALRVLSPTLYGARHPYGIPPTGTGDPEVVKKLTRDDLAAFHARWFRPETARIFVVGDTTLAEVVKLLDASFGNWASNRMALPVKDFAVPIPQQQARVILVDRPGSPQSFLLAGKVIDVRGTDDLVTLKTANEVLGGNFLGRINMNLREAKGWSYGTYNLVSEPLDRSTFRVFAPVQTDRTGDSIAEIKKEIDTFLTTKGVTSEELQWAASGSARELPGMFETSGAVLDGLARIVNYQRPDTWYETLAGRYRKMTAAQLDEAARTKLSTDGMVWVVVGDAAKVKPQLAQLGLPVEEVKMGE